MAIFLSCIQVGLSFPISSSFLGSPNLFWIFRTKTACFAVWTQKTKILQKSASKPQKPCVVFAHFAVFSLSFCVDILCWVKTPRQTVPPHPPRTCFPSRKGFFKTQQFFRKISFPKSLSPKLGNFSDKLVSQRIFPKTGTISTFFVIYEGSGAFQIFCFA